MSLSRPSLRGPLIVLTLVAALVAGCSTAASPTPSPTATPAPTAVPTPTPTATPTPTPVAAFPTTLTDDEGTDVELAVEPKTVISLTPAVTETVYAVGAGDRLVAADDSSDYPAEAAALPDVVTFGTVDVEKIVSLAPDLVIAGGLGFTSPDAITQLRGLGIPVLVVYAPTIDGVYHDIELVGAALGKGAEAIAIADRLRTDITAIAEKAGAAAAAAPTKPRVFYDVGYIDETGQIYGPAEGSFLAEVVGLLGVDVITGDKVTYEIPLETLIERDPEVDHRGGQRVLRPDRRGHRQADRLERVDRGQER